MAGVTLDKRISLGNIAAIVVFVFGMGGAWAMFNGHLGQPAHKGADNRLDDLEERVAVVEVREKGVTHSLSEFKADLIIRLDRMEAKQDSLQQQLMVHSRNGE